VRTEKHRRNLTQLPLGKSKLAQHAHKDGHKICRKKGEPIFVFSLLTSKMNVQLVASRRRDHKSHITGAEALPAHTRTSGTLQAWALCTQITSVRKQNTSTN
jgi:hypothetical protein